MLHPLMETEKYSEVYYRTATGSHASVSVKSRQISAKKKFETTQI